jgi:hypothetical protein
VKEVKEVTRLRADPTVSNDVRRARGRNYNSFSPGAPGERVRVRGLTSFTSFTSLTSFTLLPPPALLRAEQRVDDTHDRIVHAVRQLDLAAHRV